MGITEVKDTTDGYTLVNKLGIYTSEKDETHSYYGFSVKFDRPVRLSRVPCHGTEQKDKHLLNVKEWYLLSSLHGITFLKPV